MYLVKLSKWCIIALSTLYLFTDKQVYGLKEMWKISRPYVLHKAPDVAYILFANIFFDNDQMVVIYRYSIEDIYNTSLFVLRGEKWSHNNVTEPLRGLTYNNRFYVATKEFYDQKEKSECYKIHSLTGNAEISKIPDRIINAYVTKNWDRGGDKILVVSKDPNCLYRVGIHTEYRYDPFSLLSLFVSGGHGGFVERPFMREIKNDSIVKFYKLSVTLHDREVMRYLNSKVVGDKIHVLWKKYREYGSSFDSDVLQYAYFDCAAKTWSETIEPFGEYKYSKKMVYDRLHASLDGDQENLYCAWYWAVEEKKRPPYEHIKERAIYFNQCRGDQWNRPIKIYNCASLSIGDGDCHPKVVVDHKGEVYVFWVEDYKGLFFKRRDGNSWSDSIDVVENKRIKSFDIAVDNNNDFHIIYVLYASDWDKLPYELVYVKLTHIKQ